MSNLQNHYTAFLSFLHDVEPKDNFLGQKRKPKLSDKELIALSLAAESVGIDSELNLFKQLPSEVKNRIERSVYNKRRRNLIPHYQRIQKVIANLIVPCEEYHLIDSMPLEVCKLSRAKRSKICREEISETNPSFGYCATQKIHYFGYKIHAVCTQQGVFKAFDISPASFHDIHYLNDVKEQFSNCVIVGDKGYLSQMWQADLFEQRNIRLQTPMRNNQIERQSFPRVFKRARKRIETLFSQLCDQFMIRRNYAKSFGGFVTRIASKLTALTLIQWVNKNQGFNINNLKRAIG